jgi:Ser/Thr protein kinase RdoA (MazF antagonist)
MFSFIPGRVPAHVERASDAQVAALGRLVRDFHQATRGVSDLAGDQEVICHNDLNIRNFVFQDELPVALLDFDSAAPGPPLSDVSYLAWGWCISSYWPDRPASFQARQVRLLADSYGLSPSDSDLLLDEVLEHQRKLITLCRTRVAEKRDQKDDAGVVTWQGVLDWAEGDHVYTEHEAPTFRAVLA